MNLNLSEDPLTSSPTICFGSKSMVLLVTHLSLHTCRLRWGGPTFHDHIDRRATWKRPVIYENSLFVFLTDSALLLGASQGVQGSYRFKVLCKNVIKYWVRESRVRKSLLVSHHPDLLYSGFLTRDPLHTQNFLLDLPTLTLWLITSPTMTTGWTRGDDSTVR